MSDKVIHGLHRMVSFQTGDTTVLCLGLYESQDEAAKAANERAEAFKKLLRCRIVEMDSKGRGSDQRLNIAEFLSMIGIQNIGHAVLPMKYNEESRIQTAGTADVIQLAKGAKLEP